MGILAVGLGCTMVGCAAPGVPIAYASAGAPGSGRAATDAARAARWLSKGDVRAIVSAEAAVAGAPQDAAYRVLLGRAYLRAGRFISAHTAFSDALTLSPGNGKAAINLALVQIAQGQWDAARRTLDTNARTIPPSDRGLAIALAGDPDAGVDVLMAAARSPDARATTRQNLALALALAGRWRDAKTVIATDVPADQVDVRIMQWAGFARPVSASDQVCVLLGITPSRDPGQPVALALVAPALRNAAGGINSVDMVLPGPSATKQGVEQVATSMLPPSRAVGAVPAQPRPIPFADPSEPVHATSHRIKVASVPFVARRGGGWFVQIGAFDNAAVARDAWVRARRRYAAFDAHTPTGMAFQSKAGLVYRLSLGGFTRGHADATCRSYRAWGGDCFVRTGAGDRIAGWVTPRRTPDTVLASR